MKKRFGILCVVVFALVHTFGMNAMAESVPQGWTLADAEHKTVNVDEKRAVRSYLEEHKTVNVVEKRAVRSYLEEHKTVSWSLENAEHKTVKVY
ncbi:MAG: hypothetical protein KKB70_08535 [Proteobacteria bacterium]|nr:hypothetical protein [Pseudomonadota bacterium]